MSAALPYSRAIVSIVTGLMFVLALIEFFLNKPKVNFKDPYFIILALLVFFNLADGLRAMDYSEWVRTMESKIPLILIPFSILVFRPQIKEEHIRLISILFCLSFSISTLGSIYNYIQNYSEINAQVLQSKNVPIIGGMHHITYSVYIALTSLISAILAYRYKIKWLWVVAAINFIGLHIISARTGLLGFYFGIFVLGIQYLRNRSLNPKFVLTGLILLIIIPLVAFSTIGSLKNRLKNTLADVNVILHQKDANYQSLGMRVEAAKTAFDLIEANPWTGVGYCNIKYRMSVQYEQNSSNLFIENRILPHNQFIMEFAVHGIAGLLVFVAYFILPFFRRQKRFTPVFLFLWSLILFGCMFECLFDRQHGIVLVSFFWFLYESYSPMDKNEKLITETK
ncbi:MAG: O-antigen ligase family protein [Flavobacteriales bacterium]|nr:O-antigen ligase family protein [Flavobacteriales bacterium]